MINVDDSRNYTYDDNGNIINNGKYSFKYDYKNRLVRVENGSGTVISYSYDVMDRRYKKETTVKQTQYIYSNENVLEESTTSSGITKTKDYINGLGTDNLIAYEIDSVRYYFHKNHLGSIDGISDNSGVKLISYEYDSYGNTFVNSSGSLVDINDFTGSTYDNERLFTGREYDIEIGLYYMRARYYDSKIGRFISRDPIDIRDDVNLYSYVGNNPITYIDLNGTTKVLILVGDPANGGQIPGFNLTVGYQIEQALASGVKWEDIILIDGVMTPEDFNNAVSKYLGDIKQITYISHGSPDSTGNITNDNVSQLNRIKKDDKDNPLIYLISCQTGAGKNSIAQNISNQLGVTVKAPNNDVTVYEESDLSFNPLKNTIGDFYNAFITGLGKPTVNGIFGHWINFTPKK